MKHRAFFLLPAFVLWAFALTSRAQHTIIKPNINYSTQAHNYELGGLVVDGIKGYDSELLYSIANLEVGKTYQVPGMDIAQAIRNYWKQGLFSHVAIEADSIVGNKIYLHVRLTAQPRIASLHFEGLKKSEREDLEAKIPLRAGNQITPNLVNNTKHRIRKYFEEKGYKNVEINITQREDLTADNRMLVDIKVDKNAKIKVNRIYITGVDPKQQKALKNAMKKTSDRSTFKKWISFSSRKFLADKYEEDKQFVIDRLNSWGYRDAVIVADSVVPLDEKHVNIHLHIKTGQKYYLRNIQWAGNTVYTSEALSQVLQMKKGDVYNQELLRKRLSEDDDAVGRQYYNNGYVFYQLDPVETRVVGDSVDLEMRISENRQATFNRINIAGNDRLYDNVIRREIQTKPGDLFSIDAIMRSVRELAATNQFDNELLQSEIFKNIRPDHTTGTVDLTYPLVTKASDQLEISAGWGQTGVIGRVGVKFTNFSMQNLFSKDGYKRAGFIPQGDGQTLHLQGQSNGSYHHNFSLSFINPWLGGKRPNNLSISLFYSHQSDVNSSFYNNNFINSQYYGYGNTGNYYNYANYYDPDKYLDIMGVNIGFGKRLRWPDDYFTFMASVGYTRYNLKNWRYFLISNGNSNNINFSLTLSRSSVGDPFFPRSGSEFSTSLQFTPPYSLWDGKDYQNLANNPNSDAYLREVQEKYRWIEYYKWNFKFKTYTAFNSKFKYVPVLMTRAEVGILGAYNRHRKSPFETYYMGGDGMSGYSSGYATEVIALRGYENGSLAGAANDNAYAYTRLGMELRFPLMLENTTSIYALAFVEAGNAWHDINKMNPFHLRRSAGVGIRLLLPMIGMMGIDWAYGFDKNSARGKIGGGQLHFVLGQEF